MVQNPKPLTNKKTEMGEIAGIYRFVVEGDDAERIYEIFKKSYFVESNMQPYKDCNVQVEFSYEDRVFRVEETITCTSEKIKTAPLSFIADILCFFAGNDHIYSMSEYIVDGVAQSYDVCDDEGKYFVRPPKTEWELEMEQRMNERICQSSDDDLPF